MWQNALGDRIRELGTRAENRTEIDALRGLDDFNALHVGAGAAVRRIRPHNSINDVGPFTHKRVVPDIDESAFKLGFLRVEFELEFGSCVVWPKEEIC